jgi:CarboxypepD_reg-like domain
MILRFAILLAFFQFVQGVSAQKTDFQIKGIVLDADTGLPLDRVNILLVGNENQGTSSDSLGRFSIKVFEIPASLKFSFVGYDEKVIEITDFKSKPLTIRLKPISIPLPEISVSATRKIDTVFQEPLNVVDYAFKENFIILLVYKNVFEKYQLVSLDQNEKILSTFPLTEYRPGSLFTSCTENIYLTTDIGIYEISVDNKSISLSKGVDLDYYENIVVPCKLATDDFIYFSKYYFQGQAQQYFGFSKKNKDQKIDFPIIQNEHNIDLLIEETGTRFPRSGDVWQQNVSWRLTSLREASYGLNGMLKIFFPKIYSPMVRYDSLLCIFNHQESEMQFFREDGTKVSSIPIQYHRLKKWNKTLIFDTKMESVYTFFDTKWGQQICPIDMKTGRLGDAIPIDRDFIEKLKIHDGYLYFLHRNPYQGSRQRMLQKIRID